MPWDIKFNNGIIINFSNCSGGNRGTFTLPLAYNNTAYCAVISGKTTDFSSNTHNVNSANCYYGTIVSKTNASLTYVANGGGGIICIGY